MKYSEAKPVNVIVKRGKIVYMQDHRRPEYRFFLCRTRVGDPLSPHFLSFCNFLLPKASERIQTIRKEKIMYIQYPSYGRIIKQLTTQQFNQSTLYLPPPDRQHEISCDIFSNFEKRCLWLRTQIYARLWVQVKPGESGDKSTFKIYIFTLHG